ncbi:hypothetical protein O6H91_22G040000 [Diphasiastrum complanatum]|uniref:Uncharacterized protein n=1 Tax=Diphasiastrum complanatum TaxID=34168 RepID=A0ACC2AEQ5_DIPCM|nr:hypothetical protein O6H91_22G040000 [Diphasiastrum complanatum]
MIIMKKMMTDRGRISRAAWRSWCNVLHRPPEAGDDKDEETIKPSLQKGEPKTTANDE